MHEYMSINAQTFLTIAPGVVTKGVITNIDTFTPESIPTAHIFKQKKTKESKKYCTIRKIMRMYEDQSEKNVKIEFFFINLSFYPKNLQWWGPFTYNNNQ